MGYHSLFVLKLELKCIWLSYMAGNLSVIILLLLQLKAKDCSAEQLILQSAT